jgi:hypothetical protein
MDYAEAWHLTQELAKDPTSHVAAAVNGWSHPWTYEAAILADFVDNYVLAHTKKGRKPKPYPRPWDEKRNKKYRPKVSQARVLAALAARGH